MQYLNDKPCSLMLNFAQYTLCQNKIDPMSRNDLLQTKTEDLTSNTDISGKTKMLRKYSRISMFNILKTSLSLKASIA